MDQIQGKKRNLIKVAEICSYNKSFDEFAKTRAEEELKDIFISCINSPAIIKNAEGQTFISKLISKRSIVTHYEFADIIKSFVPRLSSSLLMSYGAILYTLWLEYDNQNSQEKLQNLEEVLQKTFCIGSIKLNPAIAQRMRLILHSFHSNRDDLRVNKLLLRLYDPIIWRYLSVANWKVRFNATALFAILFPLVDPSISNGGYNSELDNQFSILQSLLADNHSEVRVAAIQSVCRILTLYWEITPIERIHEILSTLSMKSIEDKHSSNVRVAVINGINAIINNPLSQNIIKDYLPKIFTYLHDLDIEIRYSVALLILKISRIQGFDYSKIISKKQILSRISKEFVIYQLKQSTYLIKFGKLCKASDIMINNLYTSEKNDIFESLKVARVLAELLNPSIFTDKAKEQLKNCYFFCEICPMGMVGYFCSLKILVDETIGKNVESSDLLRLAVLLIKTTVENYHKGKITYNKAKILLTSSKEILSNLFSGNISTTESNQSSCFNSKLNNKICNTTQIAIKYFTNICSDDFLLKINSNDKIWVSILQLLQCLTEVNSSFYPNFSKKVESEFWNSILSVFKNNLDEKNDIKRLDAIVLLLKNWGLLDKIVVHLANTACNILSNNSSTANEEFSEYFEIKVASDDIRALCINTLLDILKYNEIRVYFSNISSIVCCIERLTKIIIDVQINRTSSKLDLDVAQPTKKLLMYCLAIIKNSDSYIELISDIIREIEFTPENNHTIDKSLLLFELLGIILSISNSSLSKEKIIIEKLTKTSKHLLSFMEILEVSDQSQVFGIRVKQMMHLFLTALKQILGSSCFESDILIKEISSKLDSFT